MRKNIIIALAALMTLAVSCKKNNIEKTGNEGTNPNPAVVLEQSPDVTRIIKFNSDVKLRRDNPELKTREVITLDEAKDNIADLFNAVYGEPTECYGETERAEFTVTLPVDADGNVLLDDAVAAYEEAVELARESYHASTLDNKGYICMSATIEEQRGGTAEVKLNGVFGKKTAAPTAAEGYFDKYESWPYKFHADGDCEPTIDSTGADDTLQTVMRNRLRLGNNAIPAGYRATVVRGKSYTFDGLTEPLWGLFIRTGEYANYTCISGNEMNMYLENGMYAVTTLVPDKYDINMTGGGSGPAYQYPYEVVDLQIHGEGYDATYNNPKCILHEYNVSYGQVQYVSQVQLQGPNDL